MSNEILKALEDAARRIGTTISRDAAQAIEKLYHDVGDGAKQLATHFATVEKENLEKIVKAADGLGKNDLEALGKYATGTPLRTAGRAQIKAILLPEGSGRLVDKYTDWLRTQGHAVQRHLEVDNQGLKERLGQILLGKDGKPKLNLAGHVKSYKYVDPETGLTAEPKAGGGVKPHTCGPYSTRFDRAKDMMKIDQYCRDYFAKHGDMPESVSIEKVLGPNAHERMTGFYRDPSNPTSFLPADFKGGVVATRYDVNTNPPTLKTMYPTPHPTRHP